MTEWCRSSGDCGPASHAFPARDGRVTPDGAVPQTRSRRYAQIILDPVQVLVPLLQCGLRLLATRPRTRDTTAGGVATMPTTRPDLSSAGCDLTLRKSNCSSGYPRPGGQCSPPRLGTRRRGQARHGEQTSRTRDANAPRYHQPLTGPTFHTRARQAGRRTPVSRSGSHRGQGLQPRPHSLRQPALDGATPVGCRRSRPFTYYLPYAGTQSFIEHRNGTMCARPIDMKL